MPLVSVIVPSYNIESHIRQTLDAILAQRGAELEVIVVDDGSTDRTCDLVESYGTRVQLLRQANAGVCAARNRGWRTARGDYLCFVDHDDVWHPDKLALQLAEFARDPDLGLVYTDFVFWSPDAKGEYPAPESVWRDTPGLDEDLSGWVYHQLLLDCWVLTSTAMIRREALERCGGFDEALPYSEDWDLWLRLSREYRFAKLRQVTTLYRQIPTQGSRRFRARDYRTELLTAAAARWGEASPDGRRSPSGVFRRRLSQYHMGHGFSCLKAEEMALARSSFMAAWSVRRMSIKPLIYLVAALLGWRPSW